ncbi:hypothetical protein MC885_000179, partial [Smutsia gigantea]
MLGLAPLCAARRLQLAPVSHMLWLA